MISFAVCGYPEVPFFAQSNLTDIVSIGDVRMPLPDLSQFSVVPTIHRFEFSDICHVAAPDDPKDVSPTKADVGRLIALCDDFIARAADCRVLFHCTAGRARSTAAAFILGVRMGVSYEEAFAQIVRMRGAISPNLLMIRYADILMGQKGRMLDYIASHRPDAIEWVAKNPVTES